jgi:hypothetical protein
MKQYVLRYGNAACSNSVERTDAPRALGLSSET